MSDSTLTTQGQVDGKNYQTIPGKTTFLYKHEVFPLHFPRDMFVQLCIYHHIPPKEVFVLPRPRLLPPDLARHVEPRGPRGWRRLSLVKLGLLAWRLAEDRDPQSCLGDRGSVGSNY